MTTTLGVGEALLGGALLFFVPGYALTKALFPEWRVRGPGGTRRLLEIVTLSFVTSIGMTIVVGYGLLDLAPGGFGAGWSDPTLESILAGVSVVGIAVALVRGGFSRTPPPAKTPEVGPGEEGAWELYRQLERLGRDERRLEHALRKAAGNPEEVARLTRELDAVRSERTSLSRGREEEYAS
jgi:hypothetical protein